MTPEDIRVWDRMKEGAESLGLYIKYEKKHFDLHQKSDDSLLCFTETADELRFVIIGYMIATRKTKQSK